MSAVVSREQTLYKCLAHYFDDSMSEVELLPGLIEPFPTNIIQTYFLPSPTALAWLLGLKQNTEINFSVFRLK